MTAPSHLSAESTEFWLWCTAEFELDKQHLLTLQAALEAWDRGQEARLAVDEFGILVDGRYGARQNPAVAVEKDSRLAFLRAMRELDLEGEPLPTPRR